MKDQQSECYNDLSVTMIALLTGSPSLNVELRLPLDGRQSSEQQVFSSAWSNLSVRGEEYWFYVQLTIASGDLVSRAIVVALRLSIVHSSMMAIKNR